LIPRRYSIFDLSFDASYEFDWVGGQRKSYSATVADQRAQQEDLRDTMVTVSAEVARNYLELREAQVRLGLSRRNLASFEQSLELLQLRAKAGLADEKEEARLRSQLASTRANLSSFEATAEQAVWAIAALTGDQGKVLAQELGDAGLPPLPSRPIPGGLPSDLLKRRPDIRKVYAQLDAATLRRQSAETDWFPKLKLTANNGGQSGDLLNLLSASSLISTFAPKISWGALNYKQTRANIQQKEAQEAQQAAAIEKTVAAAFRDVESGLSKVHREQDRLRELQESTRALARVREVSQQRFAAGLETMIPVLEAERSELSALDLETQAEASIRRNWVALCKALGGGW
jgi:NodT family efflux transporter outer membrane factor (OMF) lipoprotein